MVTTTNPELVQRFLGILQSKAVEIADVPADIAPSSRVLAQVMPLWQVERTG